MNKEQQKLLEMDLADTIVDRPQGFDVGNRHFYLYPMTLGKMYLVSRLMDMLELRPDVMKRNPYIEAYRVAKEKKEICCKIITYHTTRTKAKALDVEFIDNRTKYFASHCTAEEVATAFSVVLLWNKTAVLMSLLKIDKEHERMSKVASVKKTKNNYTFGGMSVYGSLIDVACEKYGWTYDYVVWEISYLNLKLLIADGYKQIYLSDEEAKKVKVPTKAHYVNGDDPEAVKALIEQMGWKKEKH